MENEPRGRVLELNRMVFESENGIYDGFSNDDVNGCDWAAVNGYIGMEIGVEMITRSDGRKFRCWTTNHSSLSIQYLQISLKKTI
jgi:hypothetical protein